MLFILFIFFLINLTFFHLGFFLSLLIKRNDIADIMWGLGFVIQVLGSLLYQELFYTDQTVFQNLITVAVLIWGLRLSIFIFIRNKGQAEDFRYKKWRKQWGKSFLIRTYFQIFFLQSILLFLIVYPVVWVNFFHEANPDILFFGIGFLIWLVGFLFESIADYQKYRFKQKAHKEDAFIQSGLWKYSRHPNYFGEVTLWWGIFFMAFSLFPMPYFIISPLTITILILFISGIPLLEAKYKDNPEYQRYKQNTSAFIPWFC